ncbi:MAG: iron ABC transporter permease [Deltaproteobacteria bacterium SM23_61]|nr:MAG: iron ABC transporter permease [Deltaproteobacteria bacterium SM23_61]
MREISPAVAQGPITLVYRGVMRKKIQLFLLILGLLAFLGLYALAVGSYDLSLASLIRAVFGRADGPIETVVWNIRLPRIMAAILSGWGLGLAGITFQSLLKNPLASPSTLGISQGAAFGASLAIVVFGAGGMQAGALRTQGASPLNIFSLYTVTLFAFAGSVAATLIILALARIKKMSPEAIILAGVALSSLFVSGTILIQYFASEVEIAAVVFWTFGDVARSTWREIGLLAIAALGITLYFILYRWDLNALLAGEETAKSLGVEVEKIRVLGMLIATILAALVTCFHGVIAFLGLLAPHIGRRLIGPDHRLLIPYSCLLGALLLLLADTAGRVMVGSGTLPVGVLTSFMGAPLFLYLLWKGYHR